MLEKTKLTTQQIKIFQGYFDFEKNTTVITQTRVKFLEANCNVENLKKNLLI